MRNLKYAILGLVCKAPTTGYEISKEFNHRISNFWFANHSQVYPELNRLLDEGAITCETVLQGEKMEKKVYSITPSGKKDFMEWMMTDTELAPIPKDIFRLKSYFANFLDTEDFTYLIDAELKKRMERYTFLKNTFAAYTSEPDIHSKDFGDYIVLEGAVLREEAYIQWLHNCKARLIRK